jgi:kynurenine formamidase
MYLIDLTYLVTSLIPTWDLSCGYHVNTVLRYEQCEGETKFQVQRFDIKGSCGTHIDAPSHCIKGGRSIHEIDVEELILPLHVIDISDRCQDRLTLQVDDILAYEKHYGLIKPESCVMIYTGWSQFWETPERYHNNHIFPSCSQEAAEFLMERNVIALGIDTFSADRPEDDFIVHRIWLGANKILIENVANLDKVPAVGATIIIAPLRLEGATESPVRLIVMVEENV